MAMLLNQVQSGFRHAWQLPMAHAQPLQARGPAGAGGPVQPPSSPWSLQERAVAAELGSRRAGGGLLIGVQSRRRSDVAAHGLVRGVRPDAELGSADLWPALPDFPPPSARAPLRLSAVHPREPGASTAKEKTKGVHLGPEARKKRSASSAFEHVIAERTDYNKFRARMFHPACGQKCPARKSDAPRFGCLSKFGETEETAAHHLFTYVCLTHVGDQATTHKRQRARIDHATGAWDMGDIRNRYLQKRWKEGVDRRLSDSVYFDAAAADPKDAYQFDFKMPFSGIGAGNRIRLAINI